MEDKKIIIGISLVAVVLVIIIIVVGVLIFKGGTLLKFGVEQSLVVARTQVKKALPSDYNSTKLMKDFDVVVNNVKSGKINPTKVKDVMIWLPTILADGKLDTTEVDSLMHRLQKITVDKKY